MVHLPIRPGLRHNTQVAERQGSGQGGARSSVGDIPLASDHQCWRRRAGGERSDVHRSYLIEQCCDVSRPSAELLYERGRQKAEDAVEERPDSNCFDAGVRAEYQSRHPVTMSGGELEGDHASPAASEEYDLMRVSIRQRVEHRKGRFFQDHRCAATNTDVRHQHLGYLAHGSSQLRRLSVSVAQRGQQHDRVIDAHVLKASVVSPKFLCVWRRSGACMGGAKR